MQEEKLSLIERREEYAGVDTYIFKSANPIPYEAGQYGHVRLFGMPPGEKPVRELSFATAPHENAIWFGIDSRSGSPYQQKLKSLKPNDIVGLFKVKRHMIWPPKESDVVMIAGGIGITPFRSFLMDRAHKRLSMGAIVIHASRDAFLYGDEISNLATEYSAIGREKLPELLHTTAKNHPRARYYIAGSPGFVTSALENLKQEGIERIESDVFKGLGEEQ